MGASQLVTISLGLFATDIMMSGMEFGGVANWMAGHALVWVQASLIGSILLPLYVFQTAVRQERRLMARWRSP